MSTFRNSGAFGSSDVLRRMIAGHNAAAQAARRVDEAHPRTPEAAFDAAADLWNLCTDLFGATTGPCAT